MQVDYLRNCREEQVLPPSAPKLLKGKEGDHPFPASSRAFLTERIEQHRNDISLLTEQATGIHLPHRLVIKLQHSKAETEARLKQNLERTCNRSRWGSVGRQDLVDNRSSRELTQTEVEALSLGLKFDIGHSGTSISKLVRKNNRYSSHDLDNGFIQGLAIASHAMA